MDIVEVFSIPNRYSAETLNCLASSTMYCVEGTDKLISRALTPERDIPNMRAISACINPALLLQFYSLIECDISLREF